jgi:hypothetical protein
LFNQKPEARAQGLRLYCGQCFQTELALSKAEEDEQVGKNTFVFRKAENLQWKHETWLIRDNGF